MRAIRGFLPLILAVGVCGCESSRPSYAPHPVSAAPAAAVGDSTETASRSAPARAGKRSESERRVGDLTYIVGISFWADRLDLDGLLTSGVKRVGEPLPAPYLFAHITILNHGDGPVRVPMPVLVDGRGRVYVASPVTRTVRGGLDTWAPLNPGASVDGVVAFDAPTGTDYALRVFASSKDARADLPLHPEVRHGD